MFFPNLMYFVHTTKKDIYSKTKYFLSLSSGLNVYFCIACTGMSLELFKMLNRLSTTKTL